MRTKPASCNNFSHYFSLMSLSTVSTSLGSCLSRQIPRMTPLVVSRINGAVNYRNNGNPYIQKRTFIIGCIVHLSFGNSHFR